MRACHWQALFLSITSSFAAKSVVISLHFNKLLPLNPQFYLLAYILLYLLMICSCS
ncbi:hypothetical protein VCRA2123E76_180063 [Vibrio crassostreae]|nr:hypothetical protein VCRA2123E76_180063 [Vibrio crassostreae]